MTKYSSIGMLCIFCAAAAASSGCVLEPLPNYGEACPPGEGERGRLSYVQTGDSARCGDGDGCYADEFLYGVCPEEYAQCNIDTAGEYYCMQRCPSGQIACDGQCIEPQTNSSYCGAKDTCSDSGASCCGAYEVCKAYQTCSDGSCRDKACTAGESVCDGGVVYVCGASESKTRWAESQTCEGGACNAEKTGCPNAAPCEAGGVYILHGGLKCSADGRKIYGCKDGDLYEAETCEPSSVCADRAGTPACGGYESCSLDGKIVAHGKTVCDGARILTCANGVFEETENCAQNGGEKTSCRDGACAVPNCFAGGSKMDEGSAYCDGNVLKTCRAGVLDDGADCALNADGKTVCRDGACATPRRCSVEAGGVTKILAHGDAFCTENVLSACADGTIVKQYCEKTGGVCAPTNDGSQCVPVFDAIKTIRMVFEQLYDPDACGNVAEWHVNAQIDVTGIVTALRMSSNNYGFVMQSLGDNPRGGGIIVNCRNRDCQTYADGTQVAIGDVVRVEASQLNSYWCQLQIAQESGSPTVSKIDMSAELLPAEIDASQLCSPGEPNNPYNSVLVSIKNITMEQQQEKNPSGYNGIDGAGKDIFVNSMIFLGEDGAPLKAMPVAEGKTYDVVGVGIWSFGKSTLAPRTAADIAEANPCAETSEDVSVCIRRKGSYLSARCAGGALNADDAENCTANAKICDLGDTQSQAGSEAASLCREAAKCADAGNNAIAEGEFGCENNTTLSKCVADGDCESDGTASCPRGKWSDLADERVTCSKACDPAKSRCEAAVINKCEFSQIDTDGMFARVRIEDIADGEAEAYVYCTSDAALPISEWPHKIRLMPISAQACATCPAGVTEYVSLADGLPTEDGVYSCVAVASIVSGDKFACSKTLMAPTRIDGADTAELSWITSYEIGKVARVLAKWDFNSQPCLTMTGGIKTESAFGLSTGESDIKCLNSEYASAQIGWGTGESADLEKDPHWTVSIDAQGYRALTISFDIFSSKEGNLATVAYKAGDSDAFIAIGAPAEIPLRGALNAEPIAASLPVGASGAKNVVIGIFPHNTEANQNGVGPNIRIDNVVVQGFAI